MAKQVLGRGLGDLLGEMDVAYNISGGTTNNYIDIDINKLKLNPYQPRKQFDTDKLQELSDSIINNGLLQPIIVIEDDQEYMIIAGERRYRACKLANLDTIKAIVLDVDKAKVRELALIENIQRDDLNIIEIAHSYKGLLEDHGITHEELAGMVSKSRSSISNTLRLLNLDSYIQDMIIENKITIGHAKLLVSLDVELQKTVALTITNQNLSVRETEQLIKKIKEQQSSIPKIDSNVANESSYDYSALIEIKSALQESHLDIKIDKNYFKIKINSQEDIEKIATYFNNK